MIGHEFLAVSQMEGILSDLQNIVNAEGDNPHLADDVDVDVIHIQYFPR